MFDHYPRIELPITIEEFHRIPRNAGYKYEYFGGRAVLSPRPKAFSCVRDLSPARVSETRRVEPLPVADIPALEKLFDFANRNVQPWQSLSADAGLEVSRECLRKVVEGKDGPVVAEACVQIHEEHDRGVVGAALVTLVHPSILTEPFGGDWPKGVGAPADAVRLKLGVPHLTWIFVNPWVNRRGYGTALLTSVVDRLREMGFDELASTFALDNGPSAMWHWHNGFRLLPQMSAMWERRKTVVTPP